MPVTPHRPAGWRIEPPVSVPIDRQAIRAATQAAAPPLEPPGMQSRSQGLCVGKKAEFSFEPPIANSSKFVRPRNTASAARSFWIIVASYGGRKFAKIFDAHVVSSPLTQIKSFTATGRPANSPTACFFARRSSIALACLIAASPS